jgi:hypothetical protein
MGAQLVGDEDEASEVSADGWSAFWTHQRVTVLGSAGIGLTQFDLVFSGEPAVIRGAHDRLYAESPTGWWLANRGRSRPEMGPEPQRGPCYRQLCDHRSPNFH